jgi:hypothetical protein
VRILPSGAQVAREAVTVLAGAILAAWIVGQFPAVKRWIAEQWKA